MTDVSSSQALPLSVSLPGGTPVELSTPADEPLTLDSSVLALRQSVAVGLRVHEEQVSLVHVSAELLDDDQLLQSALSGTDPSQGLEITAIIRPCRARPDSYVAHILKDATYADVVARGVQWPEPTGININMMPFIHGKKESLPDEFHHYWPLIRACRVGYNELGKVVYLTIHESETKQGVTQRRPGLHVESPKVSMTEGGVMKELMHGWGFSMGMHRQGGLYMGSNVTRSCRVWNCKLQEPERVVGTLGNVEHLRDSLGEGEHMKADELWWLTDLTPHETLPMEQDTYRQYFRLVTSSVSVWYAKHSTPNSLGIEPDTKVTKIVDHDKFEEAGI